jgi:hypothetical protein
MLAILIPWAVSLLTYLQPAAPWRETYGETAAGMVEGARAVPVFDGPQGVERTIALDAVLAWFESRFDRHAVGDCGHEGACKKGETGKAHGLYQVQAPEAGDARAQTVAANRMIRQSFKACAHRPFEERLAFYASGGPAGCENAGGQRASRHRIVRAIWLFKAHAPPVVE